MALSCELVIPRPGEASQACPRRLHAPVDWEATSQGQCTLPSGRGHHTLSQGFRACRVGALGAFQDVAWGGRVGRGGGVGRVPPTPKVWARRGKVAVGPAEAATMTGTASPGDSAGLAPQRRGHGDAGLAGPRASRRCQGCLLQGRQGPRPAANAQGTTSRTPPSPPCPGNFPEWEDSRPGPPQPPRPGVPESRPHLCQPQAGTAGHSRPLPQAPTNGSQVCCLTPESPSPRLSTLPERFLGVSPNALS